MKNLNQLKCETHHVKITNTGYPMDDLIFAESMYMAETSCGMCAVDNFTEFLEIWNSGGWEPFAPYCLTQENIELMREL